MTATLEEEESREIDSHPWWKKPSPWWLYGVIFLTSIATSSTSSPEIGVYTFLICRAYQPHLAENSQHDPWRGYIPSTNPILDVTLPLNTTISSGWKEGFYASNSISSTYLEANSFEPTCETDPIVQAGVAKLAAVMSVSWGLLSCLTAGWWGSFSDRYGRGRVMAISVAGLAFGDLNFIVMTSVARYAPGRYWFLLLGPLVSGSLGGIAGSYAVMHAYIADTTTESNRARAYSISLGCLYTGMTLGPFLVGLIMRNTRRIIYPFYFAATLHLLYVFIVMFLLPESLPASKMAEAKALYNAHVSEAVEDRAPSSRLRAYLLKLWKPLSVLSPNQGVERADRDPLKKPKKDWSLVLLALSSAFNSAVLGSGVFKLQYAVSTFELSTEELSYVVSALSASRALFLMVLLPFVIKFLRSAQKKPASFDVNAPPQISTSGETQPLLVRSSPVSPHQTKESHDFSFDLSLARGSLVWGMVSYTLLGLTPTVVWFTIVVCILGFGMGFDPAIRSIALALYARNGGIESGKLLGALGVVEAISTQTIGPAITGFIYMKTVATIPQTIFYFSTVCLIASFILLSLVPGQKAGRRGRPDVDDRENIFVSGQPFE